MTIDDFYTTIYPVQDPCLKEKIIACTKIKKYKKHDCISHQDETDFQISFLKSGIGIAYEIQPSGKTICLSIFDKPGDVVVGGLGPNDAYSPVNVEMQTDSELFSIELDDMRKLQEEYPEIMYFYNRILMIEYEKQWQVKNMLYMDAADDRYDWFMAHYPDTVDRLNHKMIASFLRMSPVTFSRIRNRRMEEAI